MTPEKAQSKIEYWINEYRKRFLREHSDEEFDINNICVKDPEYQGIKNIDVTDEKGKKLSLEEKFHLGGGTGYVPKQKSQENWISYLSDELYLFVSAGGKVAQLKRTDRLYRLVKSTLIIIDGKKLDLEGKFKFLGYSRKAKYGNYGYEDFVRKIYDPLKEIAEKNNGFVDLYKKNDKLDHQVLLFANEYNLPEPVFISLVCKMNLHRTYLNVNRIAYIKTELKKYLVNHNNSFVGIKRKLPELYDKLNSLRRAYEDSDGKIISNGQLIQELGFTDVENAFHMDTERKLFGEDEFLKRYGIAKENSNSGKKISIKDIDVYDYRELCYFLQRTKSNLVEFFGKYGVTYEMPRNVKRNNLVVVEKYPYIDEMRQEVEEMCAKMPILNDSDNEEQKFGKWLGICQEVYRGYREQINKDYGCVGFGGNLDAENDSGEGEIQ